MNSKVERKTKRQQKKGSVAFGQRQKKEQICATRHERRAAFI